MRDKIIIGIIVLAVIILGYAVWRSAAKPGQPAQPSGNLPEVPSAGTSTIPAAATSTAATSSAKTTTTATAKKTTSGTTAKTSTTSASALPSYVDALKIYKTSGYYFQFVNCHGNPGSLTLKKGKKFMLDNRDAVAHKIAFANQTYYLGKYGYAIATALSLGKYYITCDGGGAASILVQP